MKTSSKIHLATVIPRSATRKAGAAGREAIGRALSSADIVELDLSGLNITPSFADECFGVLAETLGRDEFRERVKLLHVPRAAQPLLRHVLNRRTEATA